LTGHGAGGGGSNAGEAIAKGGCTRLDIATAAVPAKIIRRENSDVMSASGKRNLNQFALIRNHHQRLFFDRGCDADSGLT
jgi:hypothetical protein